MSNTPRRRRPRGGLHLPRTAWPEVFAMAATVGRADAEVTEAVAKATDELASRCAGAPRRTAIRAFAIDADEADAALADLGVPADAHLELRAHVAEHPGGRLIVAWCSVEPNTRRVTPL